MFYRPMPTTSDNSMTQNGSDREYTNVNHPKITPNKISSMTGQLIVGVIAGRNLIGMDVGGKSDPYCIIAVGDEEAKTTIQNNTVDPEWNETFIFSLCHGPHFQSHGEACDIDVTNTAVVYYVIIDVWDKDTLNRDDFMGRVMIPVSLLSHETLCGWFSLGRTSSRDADFTGEIYIELRIKSQLPIKKWIVDDQLYKSCDELPEFELSIKSSSDSFSFPGETERVEMVLENVVVEISKHRDVGTVYLTNYRLLILCKTNDKLSEEHSMWIAFKNIRSVNKAVDEKAVRKTLSGNRRIFVVKCLTLECCDFRVIRLTFVDFTQKAQPSITLTETLKQSLLIPDVNPTRGEMTSRISKDNPSAKTKKLHVVSCNDSIDCDSWSLCEDDDLEEEEIVNEAAQPSQHSPRFAKRKFSALASLSDIAKMLVNVQGIFTPNSTTSNVLDEQVEKEENENPITRPSFVHKYVNMFYLRLTHLIHTYTEISFSQKFVKAFPQCASCGWDVYDVENEFKRQEVNDSWRMTEINKDYSVSQSYPGLFYVPTGVSDCILEKCAAFRSKGRLPVLSWFNKRRGNFIMRCAQPRTGPRRKFSADDEYVIQSALSSNMSSHRLVIFDARSILAASANQLKGKGTEDIERYPGCKLTFLNIPNIHVVRESLEKLQLACKTLERKWFSQLEASGWMAYISLILQGAITIVQHVDEKGIAALIHCSDGWDRTAQLSSISQILLDPYYRTIKGFQVLIEKEWTAFGHRFRDRNGHPSSNSNQRSPIFLQFLDCVWQVLVQFPYAFEFTADYLLRIVDQLNTGWFGTFMCNNERQLLIEEDKPLTTLSLWAHLDSIAKKFQNDKYVYKDEVLYPTSNIRRLLFWSDYYLRYDETFWRSNQLCEFGLADLDETIESSSVGKTVVWVANERVKECHDCQVNFTHFNRRHHCRACGQIFCNECSSHRVHLLKLGYTKQERVCDRCYIKYKDEQRNPLESTKKCDLGSFEVL